jgi:hypothetical protein
VTGPPVRAISAVLLLAACASAGGAPPTADGASTPGTATSPATVSASAEWPVSAREHVDLWLHGFAMLQEDTTLVPFFERGYRERMLEVKRRANASTQLDVNRDQLRARFDANRLLTSAQFLALEFSAWEAMEQAIDIFLRADGNPQRAGDRQSQIIIATFAQYFPTAADRDWLRLFTEALRDERDRYFRSWWAQRQRELEPVLARVDSLWSATYHPKLRRYLGNTRSPEGSFYLSLPLHAEGRTVTGTTRAQNIIAVGFPDTPDAAAEAIYVFAHEAIGRVVSAAVSDNVTPAEQRAGIADRYTGHGLVRGGAILLERVTPELAEGYRAYYLRAATAAGATPPAGADAFERTFPLPPHIVEAIVRQLDVVLGGI